MILADLLEIDEVTCVEPAFAELVDGRYSEEILDVRADAARLVIDEEEQPLALAVRSENVWYAVHFVFRAPGMKIYERAEELDADIYQEPRNVWLAGLREYYCQDLRETVAPAPEDTRPGRDTEIRDLVTDVWSGFGGKSCIDGCCGSGIASAVLRGLGMNTLAYDNDPALLSLGLATGRLAAEDTMWIDGADASVYCPPADRAVGLMLGDIRPYQADLWEAIVEEILFLSQETLFSTATEPEIRMISGWCTAEGRRVEVFETDRDPIYDRWVCLVR